METVLCVSGPLQWFVWVLLHVKHSHRASRSSSKEPNGRWRHGKPAAGLCVERMWASRQKSSPSPANAHIDLTHSYTAPFQISEKSSVSQGWPCVFYFAQKLIIKFCTKPRASPPLFRKMLVGLCSACQRSRLPPLFRRNLLATVKRLQPALAVFALRCIPSHWFCRRRSWPADW